MAIVHRRYTCKPINLNALLLRYRLFAAEKMLNECMIAFITNYALLHAWGKNNNLHYIAVLFTFYIIICMRFMAIFNDLMAAIF